MSDTPTHDEWISAYLDGALDEAGMAAFEAALASDPALAAQLERLTANDTLLRAAFAAPIEDGTDPALLARMGLAEPTSAQVLPPSRPQAANDNPPFWRNWRWPAAGAVAAALALVLTVGLPNGGPAPLAFGPALEGTPSGQVALLADGSELTPVLSFAAADGRFCREFSLSNADAGGKGVACRSGGANWQVEALEPGATRLANAGGIALAAGADGAVLATAYARLGAGDPLPLARERELIDGNWTAGE